MISSLTDHTREIRKFGVIALLFFGTLFCLALWRHRVILTFFCGILSFLGLCLLLFPAPLRPIYVAWLKFAHFIGRTSTTIILTLTYYLVITPTALVRRLFGGSPLPTSPDKKISSYWVTRSELVQPKERFVKRY